jgi:hypothetical protein
VGCGHKRDSGFFRTRNETARVFKAAKKALSFVALSLEVAGVGALVQPVYFGWNDGPRALPSDGGQHVTRVIGLVAYDRAR